MKRMKRGRPSKLTPESQEEICKYVKQGLTYEDAVPTRRDRRVDLQSVEEEGPRG